MLMQPKTLTLFLFLLISFASSAQDKIYPTRRGLIEGKVMESTRGRVIYRLKGDEGGRDYAMDWDDIHRIEYGDGKVEYKPQRTPYSWTPKNYKAGNIISLAILNVSDEGVGFGISYERKIDKLGYYAFFLPVNITFAEPKEGNDIYSNGPRGKNVSIFQFMPGIKLYPTKNNGVVRGAVGTQFVYQQGEKFIDRRVGTGEESYTITELHTIQKMGLMVNASGALFPNEHIYIGTDLAIGTTFIHRLSGAEYGAKLLINYNFRIGYRF
jgi:hypothetical protein